jgi:endogenous inhibitor of DNA gyrase (YacG/DUF329 family)
VLKDLQRGHREEKKRAMKHKCPICKAETDSAVHGDFPFCSERCRERDLGNWATEKYVVTEPVFDEEEVANGERNAVVLNLDNDLDKQNDTEH